MLLPWDSVTVESQEAHGALNGTAPHLGKSMKANIPTARPAATVARFLILQSRGGDPSLQRCLVHMGGNKRSGKGKSTSIQDSSF